MTWDDYDLASIEAQVMLLGIYKSFEELEDNLTIEEMTLMLKARQEEKDAHERFLAAINGIKLDGPDGAGGDAAEIFEQVQREVELEQQAALTGKTEEQLELESLGIKFG